MMDAQLKMLGGKILVKVSGDTQAELFAQVAAVQAIFDAESKCGICGCTDLRLSHRQPQGFDYYELVCCNHQCGARFQFGQLKDEKGALFPKRDRGEGGWEIYHRDNDGGYTQQAQQPARQAPAQGRAPAPRTANPGPPPPPPPADRW